MPKLTWTVKGENKSVDVTDSCSIGREPTNTVSLPTEAGSSRRHCQIMKIGGGVYELSDLGSTNGTKVNGQTVKRHKLKAGDVIRIGETELTWDGESAASGGDDEILLEEPAGAGASSGASSGSASPGGTSGEKCFLSWSGGAKDGQKIALDQKRTTFGRNPKNTHQIDDAGASGYHCEIVREGGAYVLRDLGSTNGTMVDGEPCSETALQHGARIRIGGAKFVFVDPSVSDFEKAMSSVDDLGSEWGMLRAEMDMERVQRAKRSQAVAIGGLLVVLAGAGYVAMAHPELISGRPPEIQKIAGNTVADFSAEEGPSGWPGLADTPVTARVADAKSGAAAQGASFVLVARDGNAGRGAAAASPQTVSVNPEKTYAFGAKVRAKNGGAAAVRVTWLASDGVRVVGHSATNVASPSDWTALERAGVRTPRDAASGRVELVNAGGGEAHFDDIFFKESAGGEPQPVSAGSMSWTVSSDGQGTLRRGDRALLSSAAVVGGIFRPECADDARRADRSGSQTVAVANGGETSGECWDPVKGALGKFSVAMKLENERACLLTATLPEAAGISAYLPAKAVDEGIGVRTSTSFTRVGESRTIEHVQSVTVGDRERFEISATDGGAFRMALQRSAQGWLIVLGAEGADGKLSVRIDSDSAALTAAVDALRRSAPEELQRKRLGSAAKQFRELANSLPQGSADALAATQRADEIERDGATRLKQITDARTAAVEFQDDAALAEVSVRAKDLAREFEGHEVATGAQAEVAALTAAAATRATVLAERRAAPLVMRAEDYEKRNSPRLAQAIWRGIVSAYPGTEAAKKAEAAVQRLSAGN